MRSARSRRSSSGTTGAPRRLAHRAAAAGRRARRGRSQHAAAVPELPAAMDERLDGRFHWKYFNQPGVADTELDQDTLTTLRKIFFMASGDAPGAGSGDQPLIEPGRGRLATTPGPETLRSGSPRRISTPSPRASPRASPGRSTGTATSIATG